MVPTRKQEMFKRVKVDTCVVGSIVIGHWSCCGNCFPFSPGKFCKATKRCLWVKYANEDQSSIFSKRKDKDFDKHSSTLSLTKMSDQNDGFV